MVDRNEGHPFAENPDGSFIVPLNALPLIRVATSVYSTQPNTTVPDRVDSDVPSEIALVHFDGDPASVEAILDTAWVYGRAFLEASNTEGVEPHLVYDLFYQAMMGIADLNRDLE
jgi:hypothetical protein